MPVNYQYAQQYVGQPVICHIQGGVKHYGIVQRVTRDGIWLRPLPRRGVPVSGETKSAQITTADKPKATQAEQVYWGWGWGWGAPFFLPFFALLALSPFLWW